MQQQIEKLKQEKEKLTVEYRNNQSQYKSEIKRISKAIRSFEKGVNELNGVAAKPKRQKSSSAIEQILSEHGALHIKELVKKLNERGVPMGYQSLSGIMQLFSKAGKKFNKVAPATYALIENNDQEQETGQTIVYELDEAEPKTKAKAKAKTGENDGN